MADASQRVSDPSLTGRILMAHKDRRAAMRRLLVHGRGESEALFFVMLAAGIWFVADIPRVILGLERSGAPDLDVQGAVTSWLITVVVIVTLLRYILSMLSRWGAKAFGGTGTHLGARYAQFWSALITAPLLFPVGILYSAALTTGSDEVYQIAQWAQTGVQVIFLWFWAEALAEAEGFASTFVAILAILWPLVALGCFVALTVWGLGL